MTHRSQTFTPENLGNLYANHPYLLIFQKDDWSDYLIVLSSIYDLLEEEKVKIHYEPLRSLVLQYFSQSNLASADQKVIQFFSMMIGELEALRDSHDHLGQRYIESTKYGKELLIFVEKLLSQRVRYSGTGAETLLGALNNIVLGAVQMSDEQALQHHREKIQAYQKDMQKIKKDGVAAAELLPLPHSNEALFSQAEDAAIHIISSIEDVKSAIEEQRQILAESYFEMKTSAGKSINSITDFYERLYLTAEYTSYNQAKNLLSYLDGFNQRFPQKNIDRLLHEINKKNILPEQHINQSHINGFMQFFRSADQNIQEKIRTQIGLLQQQVLYAITTDVQGLQRTLENIFLELMNHKTIALSFFDEEPIGFNGVMNFDFGGLDLFHFESSPEIRAQFFELNEMNDDEKRALFEILLQAEETTIQQILEHIREVLSSNPSITLQNFPIRYGLSEYYVLSEISLFDKKLFSSVMGTADIHVPTKHGPLVICNTVNMKYSMIESEDL